MLQIMTMVFGIGWTLVSRLKDDRIGVVMGMLIYILNALVYANMNGLL